MIEHKTQLYQTKDFILYELSTHLILLTFTTFILVL